MQTPIPLTQKAAILEDYEKDIVIKTDHPVVQPSELKPNECLIKLEFSGVCHSDLHIRKADWSKKSILPLVGGHEGIGRVVAIGDDSHAGGVKIGDRVGVKWIGGVCGRCVQHLSVSNFHEGRLPALSLGVKCVAKDMNLVSRIQRPYLLIVDCYSLQPAF